MNFVRIENTSETIRERISILCSSDWTTRYDETIEPCFLKHSNVDTFEFGNFEMNICFVGIETEANKARSFSIEINEQYQQLVSRESFRGEFSEQKIGNH
jgi:hypothetical protein